MSILPHLGSNTSGKKVLIVDARSYAAAYANRAKGGGCEFPGRVLLLLTHPMEQLTPSQSRGGCEFPGRVPLRLTNHVEQLTSLRLRG